MNQNVVCLVSGEPGLGKSGLVLQMAKRLQDEFDPLRQIATKQEQIGTISAEQPRGAVVDIDEAMVAGGNKRRAMHAQNVANLEFLATCRKRNQIVFFIVPHMDEADRGIQEYAHLWIKVVKTGKAVFHVPENWSYKGRSIYWRPVETLGVVDFPNCEVAQPDLWAAYNKRIWGYLEEGSTSQRLLRDRQVIRRVLREV